MVFTEDSVFLLWESFLEFFAWATKQERLLVLIIFVDLHPFIERMAPKIKNVFVMKVGQILPNLKMNSLNFLSWQMPDLFPLHQRPVI